jgi:hypothetical protein
MAYPLLAFAIGFPKSRNAPTWDQWSLVSTFDAIDRGQPIARLLFEPYNGQHHPVARALMVGLGRLTHWNVRAEIALTYVLAAATLGLLLRLVWETDRRLLILAAPIAALVYSPHQYETFLSGYPMGQQLQQLLWTAALFVCTRRCLSGWHAIAAAGLALCAALSWAAGLTAWGVGFLALAVRRRDRPIWAAAWGLATVALTVAAREAGRSAGPMALAKAPAFLLVLLGRELSPVGWPSADLALALGLGFCVALTSVLTLTGRRLLGALFPWALCAAGTLAGVAMIAAGRASVGLDQALSSHYSTVVYPAAVATLVIAGKLLLDRSDNFSTDGPRWASRTLAPAILGLASLLLVGQQALAARQILPTLDGWVTLSRQRFERLRAGEATDEDIHGSFHPDADLVRREARTLHRLGYAGFGAETSGPP